MRKKLVVDLDTESNIEVFDTVEVQFPEIKRRGLIVDMPLLEDFEKHVPEKHRKQYYKRREYLMVIVFENNTKMLFDKETMTCLNLKMDGIFVYELSSKPLRLKDLNMDNLKDITFDEI